MENNELKKVVIKNRSCYYIDDIIKIEDFDFGNKLLDKKSYENILIFNISYKTVICAKPLRTRFNKVFCFIRVYNITRYFVLFGPKKYDAIYNRIRYLISPKSHICFSHNYPKAKIDLNDSLPLEITLILHNVVILSFW